MNSLSSGMLLLVLVVLNHQRPRRFRRRSRLVWVSIDGASLARSWGGGGRG